MDDIRIEVVNPQDAAELLAIYAPYVETTTVTFEYDVPTLQDFTGRVESTLPKYPYLKAVRGEEILGYAYAGAFHVRAAYGWAATASIYVRQDARRGGLGRMLYTALEERLRRQGIAELFACITYPNPDSIAFHERMGYRTVGHYDRCGYKFGRWLDVVWMQKELLPHEGEPAPVLPFPQEEELAGIAAKFAQSGWELLAAPAEHWLQNGDNRAELLAAVEEAERQCGSCGCEFDPLYKRALELLK